MTIYKPQTRNEIRTCKWFDINHLPEHLHDGAAEHLGIRTQLFDIIFPMVKKLRCKLWRNDNWRIRDPLLRHETYNQQQQQLTNQQRYKSEKSECSWRDHANQLHPTVNERPSRELERKDTRVSWREKKKLSCESSYQSPNCRRSLNITNESNARPLHLKRAYLRILRMQGKRVK